MGTARRAQLEGRNADHLSAALAVPEPARILANYKLAVKAFLAPDAPDALDLARQAAAGPTATHALQVIALYRAQLARPLAPLRCMAQPGRWDSGSVSPCPP